MLQGEGSNLWMHRWRARKRVVFDLGLDKQCWDGSPAWSGCNDRSQKKRKTWVCQVELLVYMEYQSPALWKIFEYVGKKSVLPLENSLGRGSQPAVACRDTWTWVAHPKWQKIYFTKPQCKMHHTGCSHSALWEAVEPFPILSSLHSCPPLPPHLWCVHGHTGSSELVQSSEWV